MSKLEIYTIEEVQSFPETNILADLPVVVQDIIAFFYMIHIIYIQNSLYTFLIMYLPFELFP